MSTRRRLPPGARRVTLPSGERRVEVIIDAGVSPATGKRRQARRRFRTADEALTALTEIRAASKTGGYAVRSSLTLASLCESWLRSRHGL